MGEADVLRILASLGDRLSGNHPTDIKLMEGFFSRVAFTFLSLVLEDFENLGRGKPGADGRSWLPLSAAYLAYTRPRVGRKRPKAGGLWPGNRDSFMTKAQLRTWQRDYARNLRWLALKHDEDTAKRIAAAIATKRYKDAGGKVKISHPRFGGRKVGVDYQTLVSTGTLRRSLLPGRLGGPRGWEFYAPPPNQIYRYGRGQLLVGTRVRYARFHHHARSERRRRRFWPDRLPVAWRKELLEQAEGGVNRIVELIERGREAG